LDLVVSGGFEWVLEPALLPTSEQSLELPNVELFLDFQVLPKESEVALPLGIGDVLLIAPKAMQATAQFVAGVAYAICTNMALAD
jgi:hypothetical protein